MAQTQFKYQGLQVLKNIGLIRIKDVIVKVFFDIRKQGFDDVGSKSNKYGKTYPILGKK